MKKTLLLSSLVAFSLLFSACSDSQGDENATKVTPNTTVLPFPKQTQPNQIPNPNQTPTQTQIPNPNQNPTTSQIPNPNQNPTQTQNPTTSTGSGQYTSDGYECAQVISVGEPVCILQTFNPQDDADIKALYTNLYNFYAPEFTSIFNLYIETDPGGFNAFYTNLNSQDDYLFLGARLFYTLKKEYPQNYLKAVTGVLAHEYGHLLQMRIPIDESIFYGSKQRQQVNAGSTVILSELEADSFSGLYMYMEFQSESEFNDYFNMLLSIGGGDYTNPGYHGTGEQRQAAGALGLIIADKIVSGEIADITNEGLRIEFLTYIINNILVDENFRTMPNESSLLNLSDDENALIKDILRGTKSLNDVHLNQK